MKKKYIPLLLALFLVVSLISLKWALTDYNFNIMIKTRCQSSILLRFTLKNLNSINCSIIATYRLIHNSE